MFRINGWIPEKMKATDGLLETYIDNQFDKMEEMFRSGKAIDQKKLLDYVLTGEYNFENPEANALADEIFWQARWSISEAIS